MLKKGLSNVVNHHKSIKHLQNSYQGFSGVDELEIFAMGGQKIKETGVQIIQDSTELGIIGIVDILKKLLFFINLEKNIIQELVDRQPNVIVLIELIETLLR